MLEALKFTTRYSPKRSIHMTARFCPIACYLIVDVEHQLSEARNMLGEG